MIRTTQALAVASLVAGLLSGGLVAHAQSDPAGHRPPAKEAETGLSIPEPMRIEHEKLHAALARLTKERGRMGEEPPRQSPRYWSLISPKRTSMRCRPLAS